MRQFRKVGARFYEPIQIVGGPKTRAIVQRPQDGFKPSPEFDHPTTVMRVQRDSLVTPGQIIQTQDGAHFLVANHSPTVDFITYLLLRCDRQVTWQRATKEQDVVTGLDKDGDILTLGRPWVMWERVRRELTDLTIRISQQNFVFATGEDIKINDLIDGRRVQRVDTALGICVAEVLQ